MKKIFVLILLLLFTSQVQALTANEYWSRRTYLGAQNRNLDPLYELFGDVDDVLGTDGVLEISNILFDEVTSNPTSTEGRMYYNSVTKKFRFYNGTSWITFESGGVFASLDEAYQGGAGISVDAGAVTMTATDAANNVVLALVQADQASAVTMTLESLASGALITFDSNGSGGDMLGSDSSWSVSKAGAFVINGSLTFSTADVLFDSSSAGVDVQFDESAQMMHYLDAGAGSAILGFGGSANGAADISFTYDGSGNVLDITGSGKTIEIGATGGAGLDLIIWGLTGDKITFGEDESALSLTDYDIWLDDNSDFFIGGTKNVGFVLAWDSSKTMSILAGAATDDFTLNIGQNSQGVDLGLYGSTASSKVLWDASDDKLIFNGADLRMQQDDIFSFGDSDEMTFAFDGGDLDVLGSGLEISWGVTDEGIDMIWHGEVAGDHMKWDEGIETLVFEDSHIKLDDDAVMYIGTKTNNQTLDGDFKMESVSDSRMDITSVAANGQVAIGDGTVATDFLIDNITTAGADIWFDASAESNDGIFYLGIDGKGIDTKFFGDAANSYMLWDMSIETLLMVDSDIILDGESIFIDVFDISGKVEVGVLTAIVFKPTTEEDLEYTVPSGYDLLVIDAWGYKTADAGVHASDEWAIQNDDGTPANIFDMAELIGVSDGDRVAFTGFDDSQMEIESGDKLQLDADQDGIDGCDGIITVLVSFKVAD